MTLLIITTCLQVVIMIAGFFFGLYIRGLKDDVKGIQSKVDADLKKMDDKVDCQKEETKEIKDNYLDRFEKVNTNIRDVKDEVLKGISDSEKTLTEEINKIKVELAKKTTVRRAAKK